MRVIVSLLHHFRMTPDGTVYPYSVFDYTFWRRYLEVFDEVLVFARVGEIGEVDPESMPPKPSGPGVTFFPLPDFLVAWQYLKAHQKLSAEQWVEKAMEIIEEGRIDHEYAYNQVKNSHFAVDYSLRELSKIYGC